MANEFVAKKGLISNGNATIAGDLSATGDFNLGSGDNTATIYTDGSNNLVLSSVNDIIFAPAEGGEVQLGSDPANASIYSSGNDLYLSAVGNVNVIGALSATGQVYSNGLPVTTTADASGASENWVQTNFVNVSGDTMIGGLNINTGLSAQSTTQAPINLAYQGVATGQSSYTEGYQTSATNNYAHAEGRATIASGSASHAEGWDNTAFGGQSHAEGTSTIAFGAASHAEGSNTEARGTTSHAEGNGTLANGIVSHSEGYQTSATNNYAHAEGWNTKSAGSASHTEGNGTLATGAASHAEGLNTTANGIGSHAAGQYAHAVDNYSYVWSSYSDPVSSTNSSQYTVSAGNGVVLGNNVLVDGNLTAVNKVGINADVVNGASLNIERSTESDSRWGTGGRTGLNIQTETATDWVATFENPSFLGTKGYGIWIDNTSANGLTFSSYTTGSGTVDDILSLTNNGSVIGVGIGLDAQGIGETPDATLHVKGDTLTTGDLTATNIYGNVVEVLNPALTTIISGNTATINFDHDEVYQEYGVASNLIIEFGSNNAVGKTAVLTLSGNGTNTVSFEPEFKKISTAGFSTTAVNFVYMHYIGNNRVLYTVSTEQV